MSPFSLFYWSLLRGAVSNNTANCATVCFVAALRLISCIFLCTIICCEGFTHPSIAVNCYSFRRKQPVLPIVRFLPWLPCGFVSELVRDMLRLNGSIHCDGITTLCYHCGYARACKDKKGYSWRAAYYGVRCIILALASNLHWRVDMLYVPAMSCVVAGCTTKSYHSFVTTRYNVLLRMLASTTCRLGLPYTHVIVRH